MSRSGLSQVGRVLLGAGALTVLLVFGASAQNARQPTQAEIDAAQRAYEEQLKAEERARLKDPAWRPSHKQVLKFSAGKAGSVNNFCVGSDGNLLVCIGGDRVEYDYDPNTRQAKTRIVKAAAQIDTFSPAGKRLKTWRVDVKPDAICTLPSGSIYFTGMGKIAKISPAGKVLVTADVPGLQGAEMSGIAATNSDLFVVGQSPKDYSFVVVRFDHALKNPKQIVRGLSGCCGQMDIQTFGNQLWVAHNGRHKVEQYDRDGKKLSSFGRSDREAASGFGGCCEPKNIRFGKNGILYAAESGPPNVIKSFSRDGKFLGVIALPDIQTGCVRTTVDVSQDGKTWYVINADAGTIHVIR